MTVIKLIINSYQLNKPVLYIILFLNAYCCAQQNLVPNPSFEEYWECPTAPGSVGDNQLERCKFWYKPNNATTDYYNRCQNDQSTGVSVPSNWFGYQEPFDGDSYVGLIIYEETAPQVSEYVQCKLSSPLEACRRYKISFYATLADYSQRATLALGLRLDKEPIQQVEPFGFYAFDLQPHASASYTIKDTVNWVRIESEYVAYGGEQYLTIGRFMDTNLYSNDAPPNEINECDSCMTFGIPCQYYIDMVCVTELIEENQSVQISVPNVLTANLDGINDVWYPTVSCMQDWSCDILNRWGNVVYSFNEGESGWYGSNSKDQPLSEGVYFYKIYTEDQQKTGFIHLIR
jgi:OOP family OmpA-OmpF porin